MKLFIVEFQINKVSAPILSIISTSSTSVCRFSSPYTQPVAVLGKHTFQFECCRLGFMFLNLFVFCLGMFVCFVLFSFDIFQNMVQGEGTSAQSCLSDLL